MRFDYFCIFYMLRRAKKKKKSAKKELDVSPLLAKA